MSRTPAAALLGLVLGCLALGPALGWGFVLAQDMVFVPDPGFSRFTFGLAGGAPRVVPSDAVVTALSAVLPGELVQKAILLLVFVLGCSGAARLVPSGGLGPGLVAGAFYVWNPYVAERLLMGQWALLLGYAGLPWAVAAASSPAVRARRFAVAALPAAVGGFAAMTVTALTALPVAALTALPVAVPGLPGAPARRPRVRRVVAVAVVLGAFSLPWLVPALLRPAALTGDGVGVEAFAARADGPFGAVGALLSLGGIWNAYAVPAGYGTPVGATARLLLALAGIAGFAAFAGFSRRGRAVPRDSAAPWRWGLVVAAVAGFGVACLGVTAPGRAALTWLIHLWGGFAVFRDAQQFVAPLALLEATGLGLAAAAASRSLAGSRRSPPDGGRRVAGGGRWVAALVAVPLAVLPTMAWGGAGALRAVAYPAGWTAARETIRRDPEPGDVLVLPFESYRRFPWNGGRPVLDPAQRFFGGGGREVVANDTVRVGGMVVASEDERAQMVERVLEAPAPSLAAAGFRYVVVDAGTPAERRDFDRLLQGARLLVDTPDLRLYRFGGPIAQGSSE
ncbi:hypothetical protein [Nonomuraea rhodomycinica]|uniref:4-amino-4-deoxy-L-arabinose transferase n=1 Tax=Nonomuraea rhodomycinica TaxID=1712872 RepID=A0A7Y6IMT0_9ACTN|nr:hypothetical protein [Nonomuraea rhodomycinica]NUW41159.1 hypothetical protein [Nonomuraea rhodomycinica]